MAEYFFAVIFWQWIDVYKVIIDFSVNLDPGTKWHRHLPFEQQTLLFPNTLKRGVSQTHDAFGKKMPSIFSEFWVVQTQGPLWIILILDPMDADFAPQVASKFDKLA